MSFAFRGLHPADPGGAVPLMGRTDGGVSTTAAAAAAPSRSNEYEAEDTDTDTVMEMGMGMGMGIHGNQPLTFILDDPDIDYSAQFNLDFAQHDHHTADNHLHEGIAHDYNGDMVHRNEAESQGNRRENIDNSMNGAPSSEPSPVSAFLASLDPSASPITSNVDMEHDSNIHYTSRTAPSSVASLSPLPLAFNSPPKFHFGQTTFDFVSPSHVPPQSLQQRESLKLVANPTVEEDVPGCNTPPKPSVMYSIHNPPQFAVAGFLPDSDGARQPARKPNLPDFRPSSPAAPGKSQAHRNTSPNSKLPVPPAPFGKSRSHPELLQKSSSSSSPTPPHQFEMPRTPSSSVKKSGSKKGSSANDEIQVLRKPGNFRGEMAYYISRKLKNPEIQSLINKWTDRGFTFSQAPMEKPLSGSLFMFEKDKTKDYRKDAHKWKKRKDGKSIREDHVKMKLEGGEYLFGYYAHSIDSPHFHRRVYTLVSKPNLLLVHYLDDAGEEGDEIESLQGDVVEDDSMGTPLSEYFISSPPPLPLSSATDSDWRGVSSSALPSDTPPSTSPQFSATSGNQFEILDFAPEWSSEEGGTKILLVGNWDEIEADGPIFCSFDGALTKAQFVQRGVLRTYCPAHLPGMVRLSVVLGNTIISRPKDFEYRPQQGRNALINWSLVQDSDLHAKLMEGLKQLEEHASKVSATQQKDDTPGPSPSQSLSPSPGASPSPSPSFDRNRRPSTPGEVEVELGTSALETKLIGDFHQIMLKIGKQNFVKHFWEYRDAFSCTLAHYICALGLGKLLSFVISAAKSGKIHQKFDQEKEEVGSQYTPLAVTCIRGQEAVLRVFLSKPEMQPSPGIINILANLAEMHGQIHMTECLKEYVINKSLEMEDAFGSSEALTPREIRQNPDTPQTTWIQNAMENVLSLKDLDPTALDLEAKKIQRAFRKYKTSQKAAVKAQQRRGSLKRAPSFERLLTSEDANQKAQKIQRAFRNYKHRQEQAAVVIQSLYRAHRQRKLYLKQYTSLVSMQHLWRNKRAAMNF